MSTEKFIEASGGLLLTYGIGASIGPLAAAWAMRMLGVGGLFAFTALVHFLFALFTFYRIMHRSRAPEDERSPFVQANSNRTTPVIATLDPRAPESATLGEED